MKTVKMICITGGTCAGKTSAFELLKESLNYSNLKIFYIPESATEMMQRGIKPFSDNVGLFNFQVLNLKNQLNREQACFEAASMVQEDNVLIICDRCSHEQQVFIDSETWKNVCFKCGIFDPDTLKNSYDAVFHLVSTAVGAEYAYGMISNKNRIHTLEEAREQEFKARKLWEGYPNFNMFDNSVPFDQKLDNVLTGVKLFIYNEFENIKSL